MTSLITWPFDSRWSTFYLPMGGLSRPCVYLRQLWRYGASKITGSRFWPFGVTWHYLSHDHSTCGGGLPMGGPLWPWIYLALLWRYCASKYMYTHRMRMTDRTTNLLISSNVHYVHLGEDKNWPIDQSINQSAPAGLRRVSSGSRCVQGSDSQTETCVT